MQNTTGNLPKPKNELVLSYCPDSKETEAIKSELYKLAAESIEIPILIGGKEIRTGDKGTCIQPHDHKHILATYHKAGPKEVQMAITASQKAKKEWQNLPFQFRASIFLKAAELLSTDLRHTLNAATMLNQSKNVYQAEIDSACELIDFWRFNSYYMQELYKEQPMYSPNSQLNYCEYRALEGFIFAVTPFNFTSIAGNLPTAPALMGNTVLWKPASTAVFSAYFLMKLLQKAGLPEGVINFLPGSGAQVGDPALQSPDLAGIHFTGSTKVFQQMWSTIGNNITQYKTYPRIVGETGGKDFLIAHESADRDALVTAIVRGAYEYQGQKCSALSRMYIPAKIWPDLKDRIIARLETITLGPVQDFAHFMNAVIDKASFKNTKECIERAKQAPDAEVIYGGNCDDSTGYFAEPTLIVTSNPTYETMVNEIFAPVLTVYVYKDCDYELTLELCDKTSIYGLTGCIFAQDRYAIRKAFEVLRHAAGNFYINDKPTGAVVGQQPFGGSRGSGTNDKAGSMLNLQRWTSVRTIKENFTPPTEYRYPYMR
ncbi:MAG: L-glutamate gamma-semialdehyde dehydrogenase [Sedimentisphaerales bacterium]|nr:L-glutamate gamma-semialdehyde dehydrogenase [Sedimentisphaerales bacterium]